MIVEVAQGPLEYLSLVPDSFSEVGNYPLVVLLHGYGADMHDLAELGPTIDSTEYVYVLPNGPQAAFVGMDPSMRAWFERGGEESPEGVALARERLQALLEVVWKRFGTSAGQTVLVGFSQGGNLALRHGLPAPQHFAGIASIAGSLRRVDDLTATLPPDRSQRLFLAHGYRDTTVPYTVGRLQADYLQRHGYRFELQSYTMGHSITRPVVEDLRRWLTATCRPRRIPNPE